MNSCHRILPGLLLASLAWSQTQPDLRGIYVGGNNINSEAPKSLAAALTIPGVDGLLLNIGWDDIEPANGPVPVGHAGSVDGQSYYGR